MLPGVLTSFLKKLSQNEILFTRSPECFSKTNLSKSFKLKIQSVFLFERLRS